MREGGKGKRGVRVRMVKVREGSGHERRDKVREEKRSEKEEDIKQTLTIPKKSTQSTQLYSSLYLPSPSSSSVVPNFSVMKSIKRSGWNGCLALNTKELMPNSSCSEL